MLGASSVQGNYSRRPLCDAGIGKSTLLNLISGGLEAVTGHINRNSGVRMATYSQHHMDGLALHLSPLQYFAQEFKNEKDEKLRAHLSNFGISGELAMQAMCAPASRLQPRRFAPCVVDALRPLRPRPCMLWCGSRHM